MMSAIRAMSTKHSSSTSVSGPSLPSTDPSTNITIGSSYDNVGSSLDEFSSWSADGGSQTRFAAATPGKVRPMGTPKHLRGEVDPKRFKTQLCQYFMQGERCPFAPHCAFAHGQQELRTVQDNAHLTVADVNKLPRDILETKKSQQQVGVVMATTAANPTYRSPKLPLSHSLRKDKFDEGLPISSAPVAGVLYDVNPEEPANCADSAAATPCIGCSFEDALISSPITVTVGVSPAQPNVPGPNLPNLRPTPVSTPHMSTAAAEEVLRSAPLESVLHRTDDGRRYAYNPYTVLATVPNDPQ